MHGIACADHGHHGHGDVANVNGEISADQVEQSYHGYIE